MLKSIIGEKKSIIDSSLQSTGDVNLDLKSFIDKEVQCVDFHFIWAGFGNQQRRESKEAN